MPLLMHFISKNTSLRTAHITYLGLYLLSSALFFCAVFVIKRDIKRRQRHFGEYSEHSKLISVTENETDPILGADSLINASYEPISDTGISRDLESTDDMAISRDWYII